MSETRRKIRSYAEYRPPKVEPFREAEASRRYRQSIMAISAMIDSPTDASASSMTSHASESASAPESLSPTEERAFQFTINDSGGKCSPKLTHPRTPRDDVKSVTEINGRAPLQATIIPLDSVPDSRGAAVASAAHHEVVQGEKAKDGRSV